MGEPFRGTGKYAVEARLGAGAFGEVFAARDRETGATVAVKTLRRDEPEALYRFKREFRALADLVHPNLVRLHELTEEEGRWLLVMDLVEEATDLLSWVRHTSSSGGVHGAVSGDGVTLDPGAMASAEPACPPRPLAPGFDEQRLRGAFRQLVDGVASLHAAGRLHRDLKPSNVLVDAAGRVVVLDFGMVAERGALGSEVESTVGVLGTPAYMSPEVAAGLPASRASDWYAVGVALFQALTGRLPFGGDALAAMAGKQQRDAPTPAELAPGAPEDLAELASALLSRAPEARPSLAAIQAVLGSAAPVTRPDSPDDDSGPPFLGRERELGALRAAFDRTQRGESTVVLVHGTSGMGKSALVARFLEQLGRTHPDAVVLQGRCYEQEHLPFKAFDGVVDALSRLLRRLSPEEARAALPRDVLLLARMFPVLSRVSAIAEARRRVADPDDPREARRRAFEALRELLGRVAAVRPLVLFIDDLHWGDADSAPLWQALVRPPDAPMALLLGCYRTDELGTSPLLREITTDPTGPRVLEVEVGSMSPDEGARLAAALLGSDGLADEAQAIATEARGMPFFIGQLAGARVRRPDLPLPTLEDVLGAAVAALPPDARVLLEVVALVGGPVPRRLAQAAAGLSDESASGAVALLCARHLLKTRGADADARLETWHDRIRSNVAVGLDDATRAAIHLRIAEELVAAGDSDPEAVARHFQAAGDRRQTVRWAHLAAEAASRHLAYGRAARFLQLAIDTDEVRLPEPQARAVHKRLGEALAAAGRTVEAGRVLLAAAAGAESLEALDMRREAAEYLLISGHVSEGLETLTDVLARQGLRMPATPGAATRSVIASRLRLRLRSLTFSERDPATLSAEELLLARTLWTAAVGISTVDPLRYAAFAYKCLAHAVAQGHRELTLNGLGVGLIVDSMLAGTRGRDRAESRFRTLLSKVVGDGGGGIADDDPMLLVCRATAALWVGDFVAALELARGASSATNTWLSNVSRIIQLNALMYIGDTAAIGRVVPAWLADAEARGDFYAQSYFQFMWGAHQTLTQQDRPDLALKNIGEIMARWNTRTRVLQHYWEFVARALVMEYDPSDPRATWDYVQENWEPIRKAGTWRSEYYRIESHMLRARAALALAAEPGTDEAERRRLVRGAVSDARVCEKPKAPWGAAFGAGVRAGVAGIEGDRARAIEWLERTRTPVKSSGMDAFGEAARWAHGWLIGGEDGERMVREADERIQRLGWRRPAKMVRALLPGVLYGIEGAAPARS